MEFLGYALFFFAGFLVGWLIFRGEPDYRNYWLKALAGKAEVTSHNYALAKDLLDSEQALNNIQKILDSFEYANKFDYASDEDDEEDEE